MNAIDFLKALVGKDVEFLKDIEEYEWYAEAGIRATVTGVDVQDDDPADPLMRIHVSFAKFDDHNKSLESSNYFDRNGNACLNARQAGMYAVVDSCYLGRDAMECVKALDDSTAKLIGIFEADKKVSPDLTYIGWLEEMAMRHLSLKG
jgi:hypothetical protein